MNSHVTGTDLGQSTPLPLAGIVVAGGKGTRLGGRDKAFLEVAGEPIIARTLRLFRSLFTETIVVTRDPERFARFGVDESSDRAIRGPAAGSITVTVDRYPGKGPLAGIHAGLVSCRASHAFVAACDMPLLDADVIRFLVDRIPRDDAAGRNGHGGVDAIVPWWDGDVEPLHAVYAARSIPTMEQCLELDDHAVRTFLKRVRVDYVAEADLARLTGAPRSFTNVNTPAELRRLLERLGADDAASSDGTAHDGARQ